MRRLRARCCSILVLLALTAAPAIAQTEVPAPGVRAAGMGGAFTAVADDGSAVYWNPAGLATGAFFTLVVDRNGLGDASAGLIALGTPPLGLAYYRTATGEAGNSRNSLVAHHAGVTLVQSLADRLAVGATLKLVRGVASNGGRAISTNKLDADVGVMAAGSLGRIGLAVHNVAAPEFAGPAGPLRLQRRVRAGVSVNAGSTVTVAADFDLTATDALFDNGGRTTPDRWRDAAVGIEAHPARKAWLRGGAHWNTAGSDAAAVGSVGGSYAVYGSTVADAQVTFGSESGNRGWGLGLRFVF